MTPNINHPFAILALSAPQRSRIGESAMHDGLPIPRNPSHPEEAAVVELRETGVTVVDAGVKRGGVNKVGSRRGAWGGVAYWTFLLSA